LGKEGVTPLSKGRKLVRQPSVYFAGKEKIGITENRIWEN